MSWRIGGCKKCGGDQRPDHDQYGDRWVCLQCGRDEYAMQEDIEKPNEVRCKWCGIPKPILDGRLRRCEPCFLAGEYKKEWALRLPDPNSNVPNSRKSTCPQGHPYDREDSTGRRCSICRRAQKVASQWARRHILDDQNSKE